MRLLAVDAGNTQTVLGLFVGKRLKKTWRVPSQKRALQKVLKILPPFDGAIVSNVVPSLQGTLRKKCRALFVHPSLKMPIRIRTKNPKATGADRIANAVAAYMKYGGGRVVRRRRNRTRPLLIIDFGTATTFDVVTAHGDFIGGAIAPGLKIAHEALAKKCARLPHVPLRQPRKAIGRNTVEAIRSGVFCGYLSLVEGMIERIKLEIGSSPYVIATGGLAPLIAPSVPAIRVVDPSLTLQGLRILYEENVNAG